MTIDLFIPNFGIRSISKDDSRIFVVIFILLESTEFINPRRPGNVVLTLAIEFAVLAVEYCELLESQRKSVIAHQLLKCSTSVGANIMEAQNAQSKADFIHKLKIAAKELEETEYWITIIQSSSSYPQPSSLMDRLPHLRRVLFKIIATSKSRTGNSGFSGVVLLKWFSLLLPSTEF